MFQHGIEYFAARWNSILLKPSLTVPCFPGKVAIVLRFFYPTERQYFGYAVRVFGSNKTSWPPIMLLETVPELPEVPYGLLRDSMFPNITALLHVVYYAEVIHD